MPPARIALRPEVAEAARLTDWIDATCRELGVPGALVSDAKLCLAEAFANVVSYAFDDPAGARIEVALWRPAAGGLAAEVCDNGRPFDPLQRPARAKIEDLETAGIGGFGIQLMRRTAAAMSYERSGGSNRLTFRFGDQPPE